MGATTTSLRRSLAAFREFGTRTVRSDTHGVPTYTNEFWTSKQRAANALHEISYRACFKPQLPRFFIERLTDPGDVVYDPFMGRGTSVLEALLTGRKGWGCDVNPLSTMLLRPRLSPPTLEQLQDRLKELDLSVPTPAPEDLLVFYHPDTLQELASLRDYLRVRELTGAIDDVDRWIRMVAVNRLTGHSRGFFSVYTLPPNQAVSVESQRRINARRKQTPEYRDIRRLIFKKSKSLLKNVDERAIIALRDAEFRLVTAPASATGTLPADTVQLVVTSPPFLDVVNYAKDNWLRCWFCGIDPDDVELSVLRSLPQWEALMTDVFVELSRLLAPGGHVAFEVGEVRNGTVRLEESVIPCGKAAGLDPVLVLVNAQEFTKTANCWGVTNGKAGTNTNRVVVFRNPEAS